jgi:hypothetical protein
MSYFGTFKPRNTTLRDKTMAVVRHDRADLDYYNAKTALTAAVNSPQATLLPPLLERVNAAAGNLRGADWVLRLRGGSVHG